MYKSLRGSRGFGAGSVSPNGGLMPDHMTFQQLRDQYYEEIGGAGRPARQNREPSPERILSTAYATHDQQIEQSPETIERHAHSAEPRDGMALHDQYPMHPEEETV